MYNFSNIDPNAFNSAGSSSGVNIYSNIKDDDTASKATVEGWFSGKTVTFHPYEQWDPSLLNIPALPSLF